MRSIFTWAAGFAVAIGPAFAAQSYLNPKYGYRISFPDGWQVVAQSKDAGAVAAIGGAQSSDLRICLVGVTPTGLPGGVTQGQINEKMKAPFGDAFWIANVGQSLGDAKVLSSGAREHPSALAAQEALISYTMAETGDLRHAMSMTVMMTPSDTYTIGCNLAASAYDKYKVELLAVVDSFRHRSGVDAAINPAPTSGPIVKVAAPLDLQEVVSAPAAQMAAQLKAKRQ